MLLLTALCTAASALSLPPQDECANATPIGIGQQQTAIDTTGATSSGLWSCSALSLPDVWFSVTPAVDSPLSANVIGDAAVEVYEGACEPSAVIACADGINAAGFTQTRVPFFGLAGVTYFVRVAPTSTSPPARIFVWERPANDDCEIAAGIEPGDTALFDAARARRTDESWGCGLPASSQYPFDVWYGFTATEDGPLTWRVEGGSFGRLELFEGTCSSRTTVDCAQWSSSQSVELDFAASAGADYLLRIAPGVQLTGSVSLFARPVNDDCAEAITLLDGSHDFSTVGALVGPSGFPEDPFQRADIWFRYTAPADGFLSAGIVTAFSASGLWMLEGSCSALSLIDGDSFLQSGDVGKFPVSAGDSLLLRVAGSSGSAFTTGDGQINLSFEPLAGEWSSLSEIHGYTLIAAWADDETLVAVGRRTSDSTRWLLVYDSSAGTWDAYPRPFYPGAPSITGVGDKVLLASRNESLSMLEIEIFDLVTRTSTFTIKPVMRSSLATVSARGKAYFAGGTVVSQAARRIDVYDEPTGAWSSLLLPEPRTGATAIALGSKLYFCSGSDGGPNLPGLPMLVYDLDSQTWESVPTPLGPAPSAVGGVAVHGTKILFASGLGEFDSLQVFDTATETWSELPVPTDRTGYRIAVHGDELLLVGGRFQGVYPANSADVYRFGPGTWRTDTVALPEYPRPLPLRERVEVLGFLLEPLQCTYQPALPSVFCSPATANSSGDLGRIYAYGSSLASAGEVELVATGVPVGAPGFFIVGSEPGFNQPAASAGPVCVGGSIGRYSAPGLVFNGPIGALALDLSAIPTTPESAVLPGDTWHFQAWFRDPVQTSNLTDAMAITFD